MTIPELTERQKTVLGLVVRQYIQTAQPVSSKTVVEQYGPGVSAATIRNEMAHLEELGYLTHPHTSAGRVPTEAGYRFFVEHLMGESQLPERERIMIRHQFHQAGMSLEEWAKLAAAVLAHVTHSAALVSSPRISRGQYKHLELISIRDTLVLLVLVLQGGIVMQRMLSLAQAKPQEELQRISNKFNDIFSGLTAGQIRAKAIALDAFETGIRDLVTNLIDESDRQGGVEVYRHGLAHVLEAPEFSDPEAGLQLIRVLEERDLLGMLAREMSAPGSIQVIIGGEGRWEGLNACSVVLSRYGWCDQVTGLLGVLGPMRMPYARNISALRYVSDVLSELIRSLYAEEKAPAETEADIIDMEE